MRRAVLWPQLRSLPLSKDWLQAKMQGDLTVFSGGNRLAGVMTARAISAPYPYRIPASYKSEVKAKVCAFAVSPILSNLTCQYANERLHFPGTTSVL